MPFPLPKKKLPLPPPKKLLKPGAVPLPVALPKPKTAPPPAVAAPLPPSGEVVIYDAPTPGRVKLEAVCRKHGLNWGLVRVTSISKGNNEPAHTRIVTIVGQLMETEVIGGDGLEDCLAALAAHLESTRGK